MTDIKQEWVAVMEEALPRRRGARDLVAAVAPLIRADALREAAKVAGWAHMVPPDGGSPTEDEHRVAQAAEAHILALIDTPKKP